MNPNEFPRYCEQCGVALGWMGNWSWLDDRGNPQCRDCKWRQGLPRRRGWLARFQAWRADRRYDVPLYRGIDGVRWRRRLHDGGRVRPPALARPTFDEAWNEGIRRHR